MEICLFHFMKRCENLLEDGYEHIKKFFQELDEKIHSEIGDFICIFDKDKDKIMKEREEWKKKMEEIWKQNNDDDPFANIDDSQGDDDSGTGTGLLVDVTGKQ